MKTASYTYLTKKSSALHFCFDFKLPVATSRTFRPFDLDIREDLTQHHNREGSCLLHVDGWSVTEQL